MVYRTCLQRSAFAGMRLRILLLGTVACAASLVPTIGHAQTDGTTAGASAADRTFDVPAQPLDSALTAITDQGGVRILFTSSEVAGRRSMAVSGRMTVERALSAALTGTGFTFRIADGVVRIERAPDIAGGAIQLGPVRVEGAGQGASAANDFVTVTSDPAATERTRSYTTHSMSTATRLDLSPRETPQAVTVLTRQRIEDLGMVDLLDAIRATPGLSVDSYGVGRPGLFARGFPVGTINQDRIASTFNGYIPSPLGNLAVYDRIEVVRGSTGLMQGAGNPSAAINLFRKRPTQDFQAELVASAGSWNDFSGQVDISGALTANGALSARVVGSVQDADNFRDIERQKRRVFYATADIQPTDTTRINLGYSYLDSNSNMVWGGLPLTRDGMHYGFRRSAFIGADWEYLKQNVHTVYGSVDQELGGSWRLHANATYVDGVTDLLTTWIVPIDPGTDWGHSAWSGHSDTQQKAVDAFVTGSIDLFGRTHEIVAGGTLNHEKLRSDENFPGWDADVLVSRVADPLRWDPRTARRPVFSAKNAWQSANDRKQRSAYATVRLNPVDPVKLILGGRLDWYRETGDSIFRVNANPTLYGGAIVDIDLRHSVYVSYSDIFRPQSELDFARKRLEPMVGQNYEAGIKGAYRGGALNLSLAVFRIDQTNRALRPADQSNCPTAPAIFCHIPSGLVRSQGVDTEIQGELAPGLQVAAGYTYAHVIFRKDTDPALTGTRFNTKLPEHQFKASTSYALPGSLDRWRIGANVNWQSRIRADIKLADDSVRRNMQDAYLLMGLMAEYSLSDRLRLQANLNNLFDKRYYLVIGDDRRWSANELYGEPRNVMITARYRI